MTLEADAFTGALLAVEGISDARVVLNGPTGCKFYHSHLSDCQYPRASSFDPLRFREEFFFGQPRVPCTYLEEEDYVAGSTEKLEKILPAIASRGDRLLVVVNSPGASLIGDDLGRFLQDAGLQERCLAIESTGYSVPLPAGFEHTVLEVLKWLGPEKAEPVAGRVNLLGLSLYHSNWDSSVEELRSLLSLLDIETGAVVCAGSSVEDLRASPAAALNVVVCPEYGLKTAKWYERNFGIPYICSPDGAPVGHTATLAWIEAVAEALGKAPSPATDFIRAGMAKARHRISRFHSLTGLPKGATFSVRADSSVVLPLTKWLYYYLGMAPMGVATLSGGDSDTEKRIRDFLQETGFGDAWDRQPGDEVVDVVLADGHTARSMLAGKMCRAAVEITLPSSGYLNFRPRTYMGLNGTLFLLEEILNGLRGMP